eukprot:CAMPEP_0172626292 /NCGR_PEP_ID=MMETSP1068-20121228/149392_1 /TAXON_ID=35684 /ORGANISM="Pseudopedinella elastica, Strain CCMP716" /LENGTH=77 /DNA_ID=CAMNT_0013435869 /DNA_START=1 /DNA_END=234 /DNA_ORIENTATION=-
MGSRNSGLISPRQLHVSMHPFLCVLFCRVWAVSLLVSEVDVVDCISAPTARRLRVVNIGWALTGRRQRRIVDCTSAA